MIQVNTGDHVSPEVGYISWPNHRRDLIYWSRRRARLIAAGRPQADTYFRSLPGGRSLTDLLNDRSIWINYHATLGDWGITNFAGGSEMAISEVACRSGRWSVLATLIHELAHVDGVVGRVSPRAAEDALIHCGLGKQRERDTGVDDPKTPFDPNILGQLTRLRGDKVV